MSNCSMRASSSTGPSRRHPILTAYFVFRRQRPPTSMAKRNYLVEGLSGAGKSSVYEELIRRGYKAVSTDRAWKVHADPDEPGHDGAVWDRQKAVSELENPEPDVLFVCGSSSSRDRFLPYFTKVFNLRIDDDTMRRRLEERTSNDSGKEPEE